MSTSYRCKASSLPSRAPLSLSSNEVDKEASGSDLLKTIMMTPPISSGVADLRTRLENHTYSAKLGLGLFATSVDQGKAQVAQRPERSGRRAKHHHDRDEDSWIVCAASGERGMTVTPIKFCKNGYLMPKTET